MPEYKIEGGNSSEGEVGFAAYVKAKTPEKALERFKQAVGYDGNELDCCADDGTPVKINVYFHPGRLTVEEHVELAEGDDDE